MKKPTHRYTCLYSKGYGLRVTVEKIICDECGRTKAESNHWHQIGIFRDEGRINLELGDLRGPRVGEEDSYFVHDLCGEQCFHKHIAKLLGFNPSVEDAA